MGKKGKRSRKAKQVKSTNKNDSKSSNLFTEAERNAKVSKIYMQVMMENMWHVIRQDLRDQIQEYIKTGKTVKYDLPLPRYTRTLQVRLYNDKNIESFICFKYNKQVDEDAKLTKEDVQEVEKEAMKEVEEELEKGQVVDENVVFDEEELAEIEKEAMKELEEEMSKELI